VQSVARAARALLAVADAGQGCTATEVAQLLEVALPTAFHLLNTLVDEGLLSKDRRLYFLGPEAGRIAHGFWRSEALATSLRAPLRSLAESTLETSYLAVWQHGQVVVVDSIEGAQAVNVDGLGIGLAEDAHARASGKMLLATLAEDALDAYLATHPLRPVTDHTITDESALREELRKTQRRGYAIDGEEFREGVTCIGVPIQSAGAVHGTYTLSIPANRFRANRKRYLVALQESAELAVRGLVASQETVGRPNQRGHRD
jgi:DNA-binding IclR family transcriptional regulator